MVLLNKRKISSYFEKFYTRSLFLFSIERELRRFAPVCLGSLSDYRQIPNNPSTTLEEGVIFCFFTEIIFPHIIWEQYVVRILMTHFKIIDLFKDK